MTNFAHGFFFLTIATPSTIVAPTSPAYPLPQDLLLSTEWYLARNHS